MAKKIMNHSEYMETVKKMDSASLIFVADDAIKAIQANPKGENEGYYEDEIHYCCMELKARGYKIIQGADRLDLVVCYPKKKAIHVRYCSNKQCKGECE